MSMTGFDEHQKLPPVVKIGEVRMLMNVEGCLDHNPFLRGLQNADLSALFCDIAKGVHAAAENLSSQTGVELVGLADTARAVDGLSARHKGDVEMIDVTLMPLFGSLVKEPYFLLREMERNELNGIPVSTDKAKQVMDGLAQIEVFAKAVEIITHPSEAVAFKMMVA